MFNKRTLNALQRVLDANTALLPPTLATIARSLNLGIPKGDRQIVDAEEIQTLVQYAKRTTGYDFKTPIKGGSRIQAPTDNEKLGGRAAYDQMVMWRQWGDGDKGARISPVHHLDPDAFGSILMVENAAAMLHFPALKVQWPPSITRPLVMFRGDTHFSPRWPALLLKRSTKPVDALADLDPSGLKIAAGYPRLRHLALPHLEDLADRSRINHDRFETQISVTGRDCPMPDHPEISRWWSYLLETESAIPQEHWIQEG